MVDDEGVFSVELVEEAGTVVVALAGEIDLAAAQEVFEHLTAAERRTPGRVVVDLTKTTFIDSAGIGVLARVASSGITLEIRGAVGSPRQAIKLSGIATVAGVVVVDVG
jgi:anti-sigma B factor antagonist